VCAIDLAAGLIAAGAHQLALDSELFSAEREDPAVIPPLIEEVLRTASPIHAMYRTANEDVELGGVQIRKGDRMQIDYISASGSSGVQVHAGAESYHWRRTLSELERTLDPGSFLRIHRSYIVNGARIRRVKPLQKGEYAVFLQGNQVLDSGRTYRHVIEHFLEQRG
jgi:DNA-binding LytR/AlgR family response regulator